MAAESVPTQAIRAIADKIRALPDMPYRDQVYERTLLADAKGAWTNLQRGVYVYDDEEEREAAGTNRSEDIGYPIVVTIVRPRVGGTKDDAEAVRIAREQVRKAFIHQRLSEIAIDNGHHCTCTVLHGTKRKREPDERYEVSSLVVVVWMRETRS